MKLRDVFEKIMGNRSKEPLKIEEYYLVELSIGVVHSGIFKDEKMIASVAASVCANLMTYKNKSGADTIDFETFIREFHTKTPHCFLDNDLKTADFYWSINLYRTVAMMMWILHEVGGSENIAKTIKKFENEEENTGGNA